MATNKIDKVDKITMSPKKLQAIGLWKVTRGHISDLCRGVGISRQTYYDWMAEDPEFNLAIQNEEAELNDDMRGALIGKAGEGDVSAIKYWLDRKHPEFRPQPTTLIQNNFGEHSKKELEEFE